MLPKRSDTPVSRQTCVRCGLVQPFRAALTSKCDVFCMYIFTPFIDDKQRPGAWTDSHRIKQKSYVLLLCSTLLLHCPGSRRRVVRGRHQRTQFATAAATKTIEKPGHDFSLWYSTHRLLGSTVTRSCFQLTSDSDHGHTLLAQASAARVLHSWGDMSYNDATVF